MSHTIGQTTENNQKSQVSQDSLLPGNRANSNVSLLSDADYEFLFNQLLEGVAHGWHDRRIIKFFDQLGDRGKPSDWIAWLERLRPKIITLPLQSKRQLGTIMIRLGELTQSAAEVRQIGTVSNRIGRELLFGGVEDVVWEYVGPDLIVDSPINKLETEETFSEGLPEDFTQLSQVNQAAVEDRVVSTEESTESELPLLDLDDLEELPHRIPADDLAAKNIEATNSHEIVPEELPSVLETEDTTSSKVDEPAVQPASESEAQDTEKSTTTSTFSEEFEFELDSEKPELSTEDLLQDSNFDQQEELLNLVESSDSFASTIDLETDNYLSEEMLPDPVAIDIDRVINLIQEDEQLARQISQKLNVSSSDTNTSIEQSAPADLNNSSIDLIEGWFNLGLKQVSGGEFDKAIASWEKALKINPNLSEAWHNRGSALGRLGKYRAAVESFQKALEINPHNHQAWSDRAHALYQLKKWSAAADSWGNAIKIAPANHLFWYNRGCALEQLESWAESISSYEKSLEIKPDFQPARSRYTNLIADNSRSN